MIVFFDNNSISIDGKTDLTVSDDQTKRFQSYNWNTIEIDGHNFEEIIAAISKARSSNRPTLISCTTKIAKGLMGHESDSSGHSWPLTKESIDALYLKLSHVGSDFNIRADILKAWKDVSALKAKEYDIWQKKSEILILILRKII